MMFDKRMNVIASVATIGSIALLFTACTSYYDEFEDSYGYGKSSKGYEFTENTVTDLRDRHAYSFAQVGNLRWMMNNLAFKFYRNHGESSKADCPRPSETTCKNTGFLYPGTKLDYVCPTGWRLPTTDEWETYYNSSAFKNATNEREVFKGYLDENRSLNEDGNWAYFWTGEEPDGAGNRPCIAFSPDYGTFRPAGPCNEQWKLAVRCVLEGGGSDESHSGSEQSVEEALDCSVTDGVKVVSPKEGESFKVGETITVIYGSDVQGSGFRFVFKTSEDDMGVDLFDKSEGVENPNGQWCYMQDVTLSSDIVGDASTGIIRVVPYENSSKGANSGLFSIEDTRGEAEDPVPETVSSSSQEDGEIVDDVSSSSSTPNTSSSASPKSSSSATPKSSSSVKSKICGDLWCGWTDTEGRVMTESLEETAGWWYDCNDNQKGQYGPQIVCEDGYATRGSSVFQYPYGVEVNPYGNFYGPLIEAYQGIKGKVVLGEGYQYPFIFLAFDLVSENKEGMDISGWDGFCLVYESDLSFSLEVVPENESTVTEYNNYKASVPKSSYITWDIPWNKFKQDDGWGKEVDQATVLSDAATIRLKFEGIAGTTGEFNIRSIGRLGSCGPIN